MTIHSGEKCTVTNFEGNWEDFSADKDKNGYILLNKIYLDCDRASSSLSLALELTQ